MKLKLCQKWIPKVNLSEMIFLYLKIYPENLKEIRKFNPLLRYTAPSHNHKINKITTNIFICKMLKINHLN